MNSERKKVTADLVLDLYVSAKKEKTIFKKEELMKKVVFLSQHLNEYLKVSDITLNHSKK